MWGESWWGESWLGNGDRKTHYAMKTQKCRGFTIILHNNYIAYNECHTLLASEREKFNYSHVFVNHYSMCSPNHE